MNEIEAAKQFIESRKVPVGEATWVEGNRPSRLKIEWPIHISGVSSGGRLLIEAVTSMNPNSYSVVIELGGKPIARLDYDLADQHENHAKGPSELRKQIINGPHAHLLADNMQHAIGNAIPKNLPIARRVPKENKDFLDALEWFCRINNIVFERSSIPETPSQLSLL